MKISLIIIGLISTMSSAAETLHIASGDWPPYVSASMDRNGLASAIVTEAFALEGIRVEYHFLPWKRNFESTKFGQFDGALLWADAPGRETFFIFSDAIIVGNNVFFHRRTLKFEVNVINALADLSVGVLASWEFPNVKGFGVVEVVTRTEQNVNKLLRGRIDVFVEDRAAGIYILGEYLPSKQLSKFTFTKSEDHSTFYHLILSRKRHARTNILARFNRGLMQLKASGAHDALCEIFENGKYSDSCIHRENVTSNSE